MYQFSPIQLISSNILSLTKFLFLFLFLTINTEYFMFRKYVTNILVAKRPMGTN
jgi:hypothetical protein